MGTTAAQSSGLQAVTGTLALVACACASNAASAADSWGAIAYSYPDGGWGYSYDYSSRGAAQRAAMGRCIDAGGPSCQVLVTVANGCGALARGGPWVKTASARSRAGAENDALSQCRSVASGCEIKVWMCTKR